MNVFLVEVHGDDFYDDWRSTSDVFTRLSDARRHVNIKAIEDKENLYDQDNIRLVGDDTVFENEVYRVEWVRTIPATKGNLSRVGRLSGDIPAGGNSYRVLKLTVNKGE